MSRNTSASAGAFASRTAQTTHNSPKGGSSFMQNSKAGKNSSSNKHSATAHGSSNSSDAGSTESDNDGDSDESSADADADDDDEEDDLDAFAPSGDANRGRGKQLFEEPKARQTGLPTGPNHRKRNSTHLNEETASMPPKRNKSTQESDITSASQDGRDALFSDSDAGYSAAGQISESDDSDTARENVEGEMFAIEDYRRDSFSSDFDPEEMAGMTDLVAPDNFDSSWFEEGLVAFMKSDNEHLPEANDDAILKQLQATAPARRVHFAESVPSSGASDSGQSEYLARYFPDILMESDLPVTIQRELERQHKKADAAHIGSDSDADSYWDVEGDNVSPKTSLAGNVATESDDSDSLSGYETDIGDTTDEEDPVPIPHRGSGSVTSPAASSASSSTPTRSTVAKATSVVPAAPRQGRTLKNPTKAPAASGSVFKVPATPAKRKTVQKGPKRGTFSVDPDKLYVVHDVQHRLVFYRSRNRCQEDDILDAAGSSQSSANNSPATPFMDFGFTSPMTTVGELSLSLFSPTLSNPLFSATTGQQLNVGAQMIDASDQFTSFSASEFDTELGEEGDTEPEIDMSNFIAISDSEDEEMEESTDDITSPLSKAPSLQAPFSSPAPTKRTAGDRVSHLLHSGVGVGSFRNNQERVHHANRFPYAQPVRHGRDANSLITPPRRTRANSNSNARAMSRTNAPGINGHGSSRSR